MNIRAYEESDLEALRRTHGEQGFEYAFPDVRNPLFLTKLVLVADGQSREEAGSEEPCPDRAEGFPGGDETGPPQKAVPTKKIVGAALLRLTAEAYLLLDPKAGTPRQRWEWLLRLHAATEQEAAARGLEDVHAWLPPEIAAKFGKRLTRLGWIRDDVWTPYCKRLR